MADRPRTISARTEGECMVLEVADNGPGLPSDPERLFEKFQRGNPEDSIAGVGLGLAICRSAAPLHGGDIRASTAQGGGARFEITLPVSMRAEPICDVD
jgi:two-component system sensor histidine kinase KdpD